MNSFHNLWILIWNSPEDFLLQNFFNLGIRNHIAFVMTVQNDANLCARNVLATEVFQLANHVAYRRHFCHRDQIELITITNHSKILIVYRSSEVHQNKLIALAQETPRVVL